MTCSQVSWTSGNRVLPAEDEAQAGLSAGLADMGIGALSELEQAVTIAAALLVERPVVVVALLMDDTKIVAAALHDAGDVVDAVLGDLAVLDTVDQGIKTQAGLHHPVLLGIGW